MKHVEPGKIKFYLNEDRENMKSKFLWYAIEMGALEKHNSIYVVNA